MQVMINICKDDFEEICMQARMVEDTGSLFGRIRKAISHSVPLPKGHGRLIDAEYKVSSDGRTIDSVCGYIAPTIIEADRSEEE